MKTEYLFNNQIYVLSNHVVASNPCFEQEYYRKRFVLKMEQYLSPFCEILDYTFIRHEFQLMVRLKDRRTFIGLYKNQRKSKGKSYHKVPHTTYIFSQAMANLQSSTAIHFNRKEGRTGALFARRYKKILIESELSLLNWKKRFSCKKHIHQYFGRWKNREEAKSKFREVDVRGFSEELGERGLDMGLVVGNDNNGLSTLSAELQGRFKNLPPKRISRKDLLKYLSIRHNFGLI